RPALFDNPPDLSLGKTPAQGGDGRQRVDNVAHGAEPHNQDPRRLLPLLRAISGRNASACHAHDRRGPMERMISVAEWFFVSPTISTRPPTSRMASRSGTDSA